MKFPIWKNKFHVPNHQPDMNKQGETIGTMPRNLDKHENFGNHWRFPSKSSESWMTPLRLVLKPVLKIHHFRQPAEKAWVKSWSDKSPSLLVDDFPQQRGHHIHGIPPASCFLGPAPPPHTHLPPCSLLHPHAQSCLHFQFTVPLFITFPYFPQFYPIVGSSPI